MPGRKPRHPPEMRAGGSQEWWGAKGGKGIAILQRALVKGARHGRQDTLDTAVQADPGIRDAAASLRGRPRRGRRGVSRRRLHYPWDPR